MAGERPALEGEVEEVTFVEPLAEGALLLYPPLVLGCEPRDRCLVVEAGGAPPAIFEYHLPLPALLTELDRGECSAMIPAFPGGRNVIYKFAKHRVGFVLDVDNDMDENIHNQHCIDKCGN